MKKLNSLWRVGIVILLVIMACSLPGQALRSTPTPGPEKRNPQPPSLVEMDPPAGSQISGRAPLTFYFSEPMERASVESALTSQPALAGRFTWSDDSTVVFTPDQPLPFATDLTFILAATVKAANGLALTEPVTLTYRTIEALALTQTLPESGASSVVATSAVVAAFNQPVVALGADSASLPAGFTLEPQTTGKGEWLNTSTYIFYPDPALAGGVTYSARMNSNLTATSGSRLESAQSWSFTVAMPKVLSLEPSSELLLPLDAALKLSFNQPMEPASVEANFSFSGSDGTPVAGAFSWNENNSVITFTPSILLQRDSEYRLLLTSPAQGRGGTPIGRDTLYVLHTYPNFQVASTDPREGGIKDTVAFSFSAPLQTEDATALVNVSPELPGMSTYTYEQELHIWGYFYPQTDYTITIAADLKDLWGQSLGQTFTLHFTTPSAVPRYMLPWIGSNVYFMRASDPHFFVQTVNLSSVNLGLAPVSPDIFMRLNSPGAWDARKAYHPGNESTWTQSIQQSAANSSEPVALDLSNGAGSLKPGVYNLDLQFPEATQQGTDPQRSFLVASNVNLTIKAGATDALLWAVDMRTNTPVGNAPAALYDQNGNLLASGLTDAQGLWHTSLTGQGEALPAFYGIIGQPGEETFGLASTDWDQDVTPWSFGLSYERQVPHTEIYMYTDRPIYRPGQTVSFRAVVRQAFDGIYSSPTLTSLPLTLSDGYGQSWPFDLPLSGFGTVHGVFAIPASAQPGTYTFTNEKLGFYFNFDVADYRKPEINLSVSFDPAEIKSGDSLHAIVNARYFFDAPAGKLPVHWVLYAQKDYFSLPGYQVGTFTDSWLSPDRNFLYGGFGEQISEGEAVTKADGTLLLDFANADLPKTDNRQTLTLEVTAQDESGQPVSARGTLERHPSDFYIGLRPEVWVGQANIPIKFEVFTTDWTGAPSGSRTLQANFQSVTWERKDTDDGSGNKSYQFTSVFTLVGSQDFVTGADGKARIQFTPQKPGTYMLDVSGGGTRSQVMVWVGGAEQAIWPNLPHEQVRLTADRDTYNAGETAQIFIPNPLGSGTLALVTVERGTIRSSQVLVLGASGATFSLPLTDAEAPNVYVAATLIGVDGFRQGIINLVVKSNTRTLNVTLTSEPQRAGPRDPVTFSLRVTDADGKPVKGEFSLAVVDLAALALAAPNSTEIVAEFNKTQPLGVFTGISLAALTERGTYFVGGKGGGGGGEAPSVVRENFPDTAYWNAEVLTDADGRATVSMTLPDTLTTWQVDVRGLTKDTRVGQAGIQIISTKDLLVRPVTPLFLVAGDHAEVGAVVHNNTVKDLQVDVSLQAKDFSLDDAKKTNQTITVPAGGRKLVSWWGTATDAGSADLVFSAQAGSLTDASRPNNGALPILHYISPQTFSTAGSLPAAGSRLELVSLPRSYHPSGGSLSVELAPSLAATLLSGLDAIGEPPVTCSNEYLLSYILPNLEVYRAFQASGLNDAALQERIQSRLQIAINRLLAHQDINNDGGWTWYTSWTSSWDSKLSSDPYLTASILLGLDRARGAGFTVKDDAIQKAREFLYGSDSYGTDTNTDWKMDLLAFKVYVLEETGGVDNAPITNLYTGRDHLSPWAQALLALTIASKFPDDSRAGELLSNLETTALRSATGAHWESEARGWHNPSDALVTSAMVVYALAKHNPASPLLADAVRYLSVNRNAAGLWGTTYESAWTILALNAFMVGTGGYAANYTFDALLNSQPLVHGQAAGPTSLTPVLSTVPVSGLYSDTPNALTIERGEGTGSLYYRAALQVFQPVEKVKPLDQGLRVERAYYPDGCGKDCQPIQSILLSEGARLTVHLTLTVPHDAFYMQVEDFIPAGAEILNTALKTSQQGQGSGADVSLYDPENPYAKGWGWWFFANPQIYDDHITWTADYLAAGTYVLSYTLVPMQAGEFRLIPARAWMTYFPEVQGTSGGGIFAIKR